MGVRTKMDIDFAVGFGASLNDCAFGRVSTNLLDTLDHVSSQVVTLAAAEADTEISMGDVASGRMLFIEAEGELEVNLSGTGTDPIVVTRPINPASSSAGDLKAFLLTTATFTSVHLTNPDATNSVRVRVCIVGDLVS